MKLIKATVIFLLCLLEIRAQNTSQIIILKDPETLYIHGWEYASAKIWDTALLSVIYQLDYVYNPNSKTKRVDQIKLQIGRQQSRYFSLNKELIDSLNSIAMPNAPIGTPVTFSHGNAERIARADLRSDNIYGEIWIDYRQNLLTERFRSTERFNESIEYQEVRPQLIWQLLSDTATLCGYSCMKAITQFRGRKWSVWYSIEIPVPANLWKFNGLPGLIIYAEDQKQEYKWTCTEISQHNEDIRCPQTQKKVVTRQKWLSFQKTLYEQPMKILAGNGSLRVLSQGRWLEQNWQIPYNPIELE